MTTVGRTQPQTAAGSVCQTGQPAGSLRFDLIMNALSAWIVAGLFLDGWYHNTFRDHVDSFITPWHAVLYSGVLVAGAVLTLVFVRNVQRGYDWRQALPTGYSPALIGFVLFGLSGLADFTWHTLFGFEFSVEALLSPPHLALAASMIPVFGAPLWAAWARPRTHGESNWRGLLPALLSLLMVLSVFTFFTQFANAFTHANVLAGRAGTNDYYHDVTGLTSILIPTTITIALILLVVRRWALPLGSLTLLLAGNAALMVLLGIDYSGQHWPVLLAALASGVVADLLLLWLKPSVKRTGSLRAFGFAVPFVMSGLYCLALILTGGIIWRIHMWLGVSVLAGVAGLGLSLLLVPPSVPGE